MQRGVWTSWPDPHPYVFPVSEIATSVPSFAFLFFLHPEPLRQPVSQTVFSLSSKTKVCLFSRVKPLFFFSLFPSTLLPVKAVLAFPTTHILNRTVKTRCSKALQRKRGLSGNFLTVVGTIWCVFDPKDFS